MAGETRTADGMALEALLVSREYLYVLFHAVLGGAPSAELLQALVSQDSIDTVEEYAPDSPSMAGFASFLRELAGQDAAELLGAARDEYMRIFIGPSALPASPYESPYRSKHDTALFQENTLVVRQAYRERGYRLARLMRVPDDHVSVMCDFMAKLSRQALVAFQGADRPACAASLRDQQRFVEEHLAGWLGIYATSVRNSKAGASAIMYPQLIEALAAFVESDRIFCQEAAYWAETTDEVLEAHEPRFPQVEEAAARLGEIDLLGLADNKLVAC